MALERIDFQRTRTDEERELDKTRNITVRINAKEELILKDIMELLNMKSEARVFRMGLEVLAKAINSTFPTSHIRWLVKKNRSRKYDWK